MKKYFYKLNSETLNEALNINGIFFNAMSTLANTKKQCEAIIQEDKNTGDIGKRTRPKIYEISIKEIKGEQ